MNDIDEIIKKIEYASSAENSLKEFINWVLGIAIGISTLLITNFIELKFSCFVITHLLKITIILALINTLYIGFVKYLFYVRETIINITHGEIKKLFLFAEINNKSKEDIEPELSGLLDKRANEFNKIESIGKLFNYSLIFTLIIILFICILVIAKLY